METADRVKMPAPAQRQQAWGLRLLTALVLVLLALPSGMPQSAGAQSPPGQATAAAVPNHYIIGFAADLPANERASAVQRRGGTVVREFPEIHAAVVTLPNAAAASTAHDRDGIRYIEPDYLIHVAATPNDPLYNLQWGLRNTGQTAPNSSPPPGSTQPGTPGADINAEAAWTITTGSPDMVIGVLDSGLDYNHPDLAGNIWTAPPGWNVDGCGAGTHGIRVATGWRNCDPMDDFYHGTHVSGIIGASGNNSLGVVGVNWRVQLLGLKFLDSTGWGSISDSVEVLTYALHARQAGVNLRVINASLGSITYSQAQYDLIHQLGAAGVLLVAAAGNYGTNNDLTAYYPANYNLPNVITVAATDNRDNLASFSNYGANTVHLGAPGVGITSTVLNNTYAYLSGTSMAAPHVAGAAALILSAPLQSALTPEQLKARLLDCGDLTPALVGKTTSGRRLNVARAVTGCNQRFADVPPGSWAYIQIDRLAVQGTTLGCTIATYCPDQPVTRAEMAVFLSRVLGHPNGTPYTTGRYADVPATYWAAPFIEQLYQLGITQGCGTGANYCPEQPVSRAEMAVFLVRAKNQPQLRPPTASFADVPTNHWAYGFIERSRTLGITQGCQRSGAYTYYCPAENVTRAQMAVFLVRAWP